MYIHLNVSKQMSNVKFFIVTKQYLKPFNCVQKNELRLI